MAMTKNTQKPNEKISVEVAEPKHLDQMTQCHIKAFPGEFMILIGKRFIKGFYRFYIRQCDSPDIVFSATKNGYVRKRLCQDTIQTSYLLGRYSFVPTGVIQRAVEKQTK